MLRRCALGLILLLAPGLAPAGPREDAEAVFGRFIADFTAANTDGVLGLFWPDALLWGTLMRDLSTTEQGAAAYFAPMRAQRAGEARATSLGSSAVVVSDSVVLVSGTWQIEREGSSGPRIIPFRVSIAVTRRGDEWRIAQFHNSMRPAP